MKIPDEIQKLIDEGIWPKDRASSLSQNSKPIISIEAIRLLALEEEGLYLYSPPFHTVQDELDDQKNSFWLDPRSAVHEIDPRQAIVIGDFGMGSDAAIILDYRLDSSQPKVLRLRWEESGNHWVECAKTFSDFAMHLRKCARNKS